MVTGGATRVARIVSTKRRYDWLEIRLRSSSISSAAFPAAA
jgi:hypothetical protein